MFLPRVRRAVLAREERHAWPEQNGGAGRLAVARGSVQGRGARLRRHARRGKLVDHHRVLFPRVSLVAQLARSFRRGLVRSRNV